MQLISMLKTVKERKQTLDKTIQNIADESGVSVRTVNRFFAGQNIGYKHMEAILLVLKLDINIHSLDAA